MDVLLSLLLSVAMTSHLDELRTLINTACSANNAGRELAEKKILEVQRSPDTWHVYVELLATAEDSIIFFIGELLRSLFVVPFELTHLFCLSLYSIYTLQVRD